MDDAGFKGPVRKKGNLHSRKIKGQLRAGDLERQVEVSREVNRVE